MNLNCDKIVEKYLLIQNPLYAFNFPISILVAIILFGCSKAFKWSNNSYVNQLLIPVLGFLLSMVLIEFISKWMISDEEKSRLTILCKQWMHDPKVKSNGLGMINMDIVSNYKLENFSADENMLKQNLLNNIQEQNQQTQHNQHINSNDSLEAMYCQLSNISPSPLKQNRK